MIHEASAIKEPEPNINGYIFWRGFLPRRRTHRSDNGSPALFVSSRRLRADRNGHIRELDPGTHKHPSTTWGRARMLADMARPVFLIFVEARLARFGPHGVCPIRPPVLQTV